MNVLDLLLNMEPQGLPEKEIKVKRLSRICGEDVVFRLRALPYSRVAEIKEKDGGDMNLLILLAGVMEPDLKRKELREKYAAETPKELVKHLLLPGEIEDISREIEKLSGYRGMTLEQVEEVKKN